MNKVIRYITIDGLILLMLLSISAAQNNVNAAKQHYHSHITRLIIVNKSRRQSIKSKRFKLNHLNRRSIERNQRIRRSHRRTKWEINRTKNHTNKRSRHSDNRILEPRYQIVLGTRRGNRALQKSGFIDGRILVKLGYSNDFYHLIFNKYAPNDRRAKLPNYMDPKANKAQRRLSSYNDVNKDFWVRGIFDLNNPQKNTKNPRVYRYYPDLRGWELAPRY